jgi:hypothetical protein
MVLFSFVGVTDINLIDELRGPALSAIRGLNPKNIVLIATTGDGVRYDILGGAARLQKAIKKVAQGVKVSIVTMDIDDPTDHNDIYPKLRDIVHTYSHQKQPLAAAISSGTPSMQVCWVLLAESGDAKLSLYRTVEAELTDKPVREVRLDSALPRILALEQENRTLKQIAIPAVEMSIKKGHVKIGGSIIDFSPMQFAYYRFFLERIRTSKNGDDCRYRVSTMFMDEMFIKKVLEYRLQSFPNYADSDGTYRRNKELMIPVEQFRSHLSKLNSKISEVIDETLAEYYIIDGQGPRQAKSYGLKIDHSKVRIR